jgi:2-dehydropantoate 2-reductase
MPQTADPIVPAAGPDSRSAAYATPVSPKFCVFGAGAIGGIIATLLARCGATVCTVARGETLAALKSDGVRLVIGGETLQALVPSTSDPSELGIQDYVIIAAKAPALPDIAQQIEPLLGPETAVVTAMNGVPWWFFQRDKGPLAGHRLQTIDPGGTIGSAISADRVIGCVIHVAASVDGPGIVRHAHGRQLLIGEPDGQLSPRLQCLGAWLRRAGIDCRESIDIRSDIWFKLWGNLSMNPISLLTMSTSDRIINDPLIRRLSVSMMEEASRVGTAIGIRVSPSPDAMIERIRGLGAFKMSMLQDAERGKPVEIDALLTVTHDIGRLVGVPTPFIDGVLGLARLRAAGLGLWNSAA